MNQEVQIFNGVRGRNSNLLTDGSFENEISFLPSKKFCFTSINLNLSMKLERDYPHLLKDKSVKSQNTLKKTCVRESESRFLPANCILRFVPF